MDMMVAAGFDTVFVGIETPDEQSLAECSKRHNLGRDMKADVRRMQRAGLQVEGGFILGFDSDKPSTFERVTEFIQSTGIVTAMVGVLQAIPGTRLYERLKEDGRLVAQLSGYSVDGSTNIVPAMDIGLLRARYAKLLRRLYSPRIYYQRIRTFLRTYEMPKLEIRWNLRYQLRQWRAFVVAAGRLGVAGKERLGYHFRLTAEACQE